MHAEDELVAPVAQPGIHFVAAQDVARIIGRAAVESWLDTRNFDRVAIQAFIQKDFQSDILHESFSLVLEINGVIQCAGGAPMEIGYRLIDPNAVGVVDSQ